MVSRCGGVRITSSQPRPVARPENKQCGRPYEVDFTVEAWPGDTMLLDIFEPLTLRGWRVTRDERVTRHEFTLRLSPIMTRRYQPTLAYEPIIVKPCPAGEGGGRVLACTTDSCAWYANENQVPELRPERLNSAVSIPRRFVHETRLEPPYRVEVPILYRVYRDMGRPRTILVEGHNVFASSPTSKSRLRR